MFNPLSGGPLDDPTAATTPAVTATMVHQLPGTKLPSPRILRAPADSSTNNPDQRALNVPGSPGTPTEEDAHGRSGLGLIQSAYVDPNLESQKATYTYGNVFTEGGASYPPQMPMQGGPPVGGNWQGPPGIDDKRHPNDNNNQHPSDPPPNWNNPPFGGPDGAPPQPWDKPPFQATPDIPPNPALNPQPFNPEPPFQHGRQDRDDHNRRDFDRPGGGERFPPDGRPDRARHHSSEPTPPPQQLEEGEWSPQEERAEHHRSGPQGHEPWRSRGHGPRHGGHRGSHHDSGHRGSHHDPGHRGGHDFGHRDRGGDHGPRRDDQRGHGYRGHGRGDVGQRGWGGNGPDRGWGKRRGQGPRGRDQGPRGRDRGGNNRYDYHRY